MAELIIEGGAKLAGEVVINGCKNTAAPLVAAALLTDEPCTISNLPRITDVVRMIEIIEGLGASVQWNNDHEVTICARSLSLDGLDEKSLKAMRTAILFLGPFLHRFREVVIPEPGGCIIGKRPLDTHLVAVSQFGVTVERALGRYHFTRDVLRGAHIVLSEMSVTATEITLMMAAISEGETILKLAAVEPHVTTLVEMLKRMGADIELIESHAYRIRGKKKLGGASIAVIPDRIEIGTFAVLAAASHSEISMHPIIPEQLDSIFTALTRAGVDYSVDADRLTVHKKSELRAFKLQANVYPGFPTDLQAPFGVLATQTSGTSMIHDPLFEGRMGYVNELVKMGADAIIADPHRVIITGPTPLYGQEIRSLDLRAGATLVIAGLIAQGTTRIGNAEQIDRGYEDFDGRLKKLGAVIEKHA